MKAIDRILDQRGHLEEYHVNAASSGKDALGEVNLKCDFGGGRLSLAKVRALMSSKRAHAHI